MTKSTGKSGLAGKFIRQNYEYILAFAAPVMILAMAYMFFEVYPFSNRSVLALDLNAQYANYFDYMHDVFAGKESLFYSWSRNLSGEFMGIIGYYLASPFNFLVWIFPREHLTEGLLTMILAKIGTAGLFTALYLRRGRKLTRSTAVTFSMLYALCAYAMTQTVNPMWLDGVLILPFVVYGIESLIDEGRFRLLTGSLIYAFVSNFYIGYMIAIFTALYFIYYFAVCENGYMTFGKMAARFGLAALSAAAALACSAFMLIPVYNALSLGKFEFSTPDHTLKTNFNFIELADKLLPNSYDTVRMSGTPLIYCGVLTVIMVMCYFIGNNRETISRRKRICGMALLFVIIVSMYIRPVDMYWHGGQFPNWLPYRYAFMISFLLVIWGAEAYNRISDYSSKTIGGISGGLFALMILLESRDNFDPDLGSNGRELLDGISVILPAMLILFVITILLIQFKDKIHINRCFVLSFAILIGCELLYNSSTTIFKINTDVVYSTRDSYVNYFVPVREAVDNIKAKDDGFYRIEKNFFRTSNDEIALGMYGFSHSSSTMNAKAIDFLKYLGVTAHSHNTRYSGATPLVDDIFGVKYILSSKNNETQYIKTSADITVEENADAMPIAYLVNNGVLTLDMAIAGADVDRNNIFLPQSELLARMVGKQGAPEYFTVLNNDYMTEDFDNLTKSVSGPHTLYKVIKSGTAAEIRYGVTAEFDGELFLWLPSDSPRRLDVSVDRMDSEGNYYNVYAGSFFEYDYYRILSLGEFTEGEHFTVRLKLTKDEVYYKGVYIAGINKELYDADYGVLREMNAETSLEKLSPVHLKITTNNSEEKLLFTTIPNEPGWAVTVNGVQTNIVSALDTFISIPLPAGENIVEMKFTTNGYPLALYVTLGGIALFSAMCVVYTLSKKRAAKTDEERKIYEGYENTAADDDVDIEDFDEEIAGFMAGASNKVYIGNYDEQKVLRDIESIVNDINEINSFEQLDLEGGVVQDYDESDLEYGDVEAAGALDLFPDDEIARLWNDDGKRKE